MSNKSVQVLLTLTLATIGIASANLAATAEGDSATLLVPIPLHHNATTDLFSRCFAAARSMGYAAEEVSQKMIAKCMEKEIDYTLEFAATVRNFYGYGRLPGYSIPIENIDHRLKTCVLEQKNALDNTVAKIKLENTPDADPVSFRWLYHCISGSGSDAAFLERIEGAKRDALRISRALNDKSELAE